MNIDIIKRFEGLFLKSYKDQAGVWTIGYGTIAYPNSSRVQPGDTCTEAQADAWLIDECIQKEESIKEVLIRIGILFNQNELDSVLSFIYNLGEGLLVPDRSFGVALRTKDRQKIADSMLLYCKYRGIFGIMRVSKGLLNRRKEERALFLKPL